MDFTSLLEELIQFSKSSKTDLALELGVSPSSLSKILTGRRFPAGDDFTQFRHVAANFLSRRIIKERLQGTMTQIFPLVYDFLTEEELYNFIADALTFFYLRELRSKNFTDTYSNGTIISNKVKIMHLICVTLSEKLRNPEPMTLDIYSTVWLPEIFYEPLFERIKMSNPFGHRIILHQLFRPNMLPENGQDLITFLRHYERFMSYVDIQFCMTEREIPQPFIFSPGEYLLLFNQISKMHPIVGYVDDFFYLAGNKKTYLSYFEQSTTYNNEELRYYIKKFSRARIDAMTSRIKYLVSFQPIGFMLTREEFLSITDDEDLVDRYLYFFRRVVNATGRFSISHSLTEKVIASGELFVPLIGTYHLDVNRRADYIRRYRDNVDNGAPLRLLLIKKMLQFSCIAIFKDKVYVYSRDYKMNGEKLHILYFSEEQIEAVIKYIKETDSIVELDEDAWDIFQRNFPYIP